MDSSSIQSSLSPRIYKHDVFLSFRGPNTRNSFVDHLYAHLVRKGIFAFKDDQSLEQGESIRPQLIQAIKDSRVSIVVFSKNYAASTWCLDEMAAIAECHEKLKQTVFPVFYDVNPSDVRKQDGEYQKDFVSLTKRFEQDPAKVDRWEKAMTSLGHLVGWDVRGMGESVEIENIVQKVIETLGHKFSGFANDLVGIQPRVEKLESSLKSCSVDRGGRVLGIWGMGGIGKTTLATVLFNRISYQFGARCFIDDVSKIYRDGDATVVQKQILRQTMNEKNLKTYGPSEISDIVKKRLHNIKVLIVLDNIDELKQLEKLAINPKLLHTGSIIIITTRDEHILKVYGANEVYKVAPLENKDAHEFFCEKASIGEDQKRRCGDLISEILQYAQNLPLAIEVIGSFLCARDATKWRPAFNRLQEHPDPRIMDVLRVSFDGLLPVEREIFLHIACFFNGEKEDYVKQILEICKLHPDIGITSLMEKSLITIRNKKIYMHEMLQELGKEIVKQEFPEEPGLWSRLWLYQDFRDVLMTEKETNMVKAIILNQKEDISKWPELSPKGLSTMKDLMILILYHKNFSGRLEFLSMKLRYLLWDGYPFPSLPFQFEPYRLVELNMPCSSIQRLWGGPKCLPFLKKMDMSNSTDMKETPDFKMIPNLEHLDLTGCTNLSEIHSSIGFLKKLAFLSLRNCSSLVSLDFGSESCLSSLKVLHLSGCTKLKNTSFKWAINLEHLDMDRCTSLFMVDKSIWSLTKLRLLSLSYCTNLVIVPKNFETTTSLITQDLQDDIELQYLPLIPIFNTYDMKSLISVDVSFCNLLYVPDSIGRLGCLERLNLQGNNIVSVTSTIERLDRLAYLNVAHCHKLEHLPKLPIGMDTSGGRYFEIKSRSHDDRSGLYIFDCPKLAHTLPIVYDDTSSIRYYKHPLLYEFQWLRILVEQPHHFRGGFDIVVPWDWGKNGSPQDPIIPTWFNHRFDGGSIIRIMNSDVGDNWTGFVFCVAFEVNSHLAITNSSHYSSSLPLPHPFYLSFESEDTEERFDMALNLELDKIDGSKHLWMIYISRQHCHFVNTGACITFKAKPGLMMKQWGLGMLTRKDLTAFKMIHVERCHPPPPFYADNLVTDDNVKEGSNDFEPKIQLPYNWSVSEEDEVENN